MALGGRHAVGAEALSDKVVIDDAMRERARKAFELEHYTQDELNRWLRASLNSPAEPEVEVEVTDAMRDAGQREYCASRWTVGAMAVELIYLAMERQRLKDAAAGPQPQPAEHVHNFKPGPMWDRCDCGVERPGRANPSLNFVKAHDHHRKSDRVFNGDGTFTVAVFSHRRKGDR